ncbi:MAG: EF-hand domain-containing protein [Erythrobacter sp.]|nr:EF-hand domain-containing protein [Erythrobacter sp.]
MKAVALALAALLVALPAHAQIGSPGGDRPSGGRQGAGPDGSPGGGRPQRPREVRPLEREDFDAAVTQMFTLADTDRNGTVTLDELRGVFELRRQSVIRERFARIDSDHSGQIDAAEFVAWQDALGSAAASEQAMAMERGPVREAIEPELRDDPRGGMLAGLIAPLDAMVLTNANSNYDGGLSLAELLAFEGRRFDSADADHDGRVTMNEMPRPDDNGARPGPPPGADR